MLLLSTAITALDKEVTYFKIDSLAQILPSEVKPTFYLFDIDETLIDSPYHLGSKTWRRDLRAKTKNLKECNYHDLFTWELAKKWPVHTVEKNTSAFLQELLDQGHLVCCLTARERTFWYDTPTENVDGVTIQQLLSVDIDLDLPLLNRLYPTLAKAPEYYKGVFFADQETKGDYLKTLLKNCPSLPAKVIFLDDKQEQVASVAEALAELGIPYTCYWYCATDKKVPDYDPLLSSIQLYYFWLSGGTEIYSDAEAEEIARKFPHKTAEFYLEAVFNQVKQLTAP